MLRSGRWQTRLVFWNVKGTCRYDFASRVCWLDNFFCVWSAAPVFEVGPPAGQSVSVDSCSKRSSQRTLTTFLNSNYGHLIKYLCKIEGKSRRRHSTRSDRIAIGRFALAFHFTRFHTYQRHEWQSWVFYKEWYHYRWFETREGNINRKVQLLLVWRHASMLFLIVAGFTSLNIFCDCFLAPSSANVSRFVFSSSPPPSILYYPFSFKQVSNEQYCRI